jgi:hypothetical protein
VSLSFICEVAVGETASAKGGKRRGWVSPLAIIGKKNNLVVQQITPLNSQFYLMILKIEQALRISLSP